MSGYITGLNGRMVLDSRGRPTVEVDCFVDGVLLGRAIVPSGASTGAYEALELRDNDSTRYLGGGVTSAVNNVNDHLEEALVGLPVDEQNLIDEVMLELDGTPNKAKLGANAMLGASMACLHAGAALHELPLWKYIGGVAGGLMPVPMLNILNGGAHATSNVDVQEFMVMPHGFDSFQEGLRAGVECYHALKKELKQDGLLGGVGDEGGFAPNLPSNEDGLKYMVRAIEGAGYSTDDIGIALEPRNFCPKTVTKWTARPCPVKTWSICTRAGWTLTRFCPSRMGSVRTIGEDGPPSPGPTGTACRRWATICS